MTHYEHRVRATFKVNEGEQPGEYVPEVSTDWDSRREYAVEVAEDLRERGFNVQIDSRAYESTVDFEEVPE